MSPIDKWEGAQHIVEVVITQELEGKENTAETSYYLTSLEHDLTEMTRVIRGQWQIEGYTEYSMSRLERMRA